MKKLITLVAAILVGTLFTTDTVAADCYFGPGCLDTSFGSGGKVFTTYGSSSSAVAVAVQSDDKTVVAFRGSGSGVFVARYNIDGSLDTGFGSGGIASPWADMTPAAIAIQTDGKILIAGNVYVKRSTLGFGIVRLNTSGQLDTSFGTGGKVTVSFSASTSASGIGIQSNGRIVVVGTDKNFVIARLTTSGALDSSFGSGGKTVIPSIQNPGTGGGANTVVFQTIGSEERIVVGGTRSWNKAQSLAPDFTVMRLLPNGSLDITFGSGGKAFVDFFGAVDQIYSLVVAAGQITAAGYAQVPGGPVHGGLARFDTNGNLDPSFGTGGKVVISQAIDSIRLRGLLRQSDGKLIAGGTAEVTSGTTELDDFLLIRLNADGTPDTSFGANSNGLVQTDLMQSKETLSGIAFTSDLRVVSVGSVSATNGLGLTRILTN
jgi:uncharacterized delta-60 repeat protein